jgi:hypothetical protein
MQRRWLDRPQAIAHARAALRGDAPPGVRVLKRVDGAPPAALLATVAWPGGSACPDELLVVPLRMGRSVVGRGEATGEHEGWPWPPPVEGSQWLFVCKPGEGSVADAWSTNGSVVIPAGTSIGQDETPMSLLDAPGRVAGATALPHPSQTNQVPAFQQLREGDMLVTAYAAFVVALLR